MSHCARLLATLAAHQTRHNKKASPHEARVVPVIEAATWPPEKVPLS